jgi:shikimate kinase
MKKSGKVIWLNTSTDVLKQRLLRERKSRPLIREVDESDLERYIVRKLSERRMYYQQADVMVNEESVTLEELIRLLFQTEKPDRMKEEL